MPAVFQQKLERGHAIDAWVAGTPILTCCEVSAQRSTSMLLGHTEGAVDLCGNPDLASLSLASSGIALLEPGAWPCIPQRHLAVAASALLLERRLPCPENCTGGGFYAVPTLPC